MTWPAWLYRPGGMKVRVGVPLAALILGAVVLYALARWQTSISSRDAAVIADARRLLALSKPFHQQLATLAAQRDSALAVAARARAEAAPLDTAISRLGADTVIVGLRLRFPPLDSLLTFYERRDALRLTEIAARELARQADARALRLASPRVVDLERSLSDVVKIADCHILGVSWLPRCPSRTASFFAGVATGVVGSLVVPD